MREDLVQRLRGAESVTVLTGAGISAASGIPTFRGENGIWEDHDPSDLATPRAFRENPEKVWRWYNERRMQLKGVQPNEGHRVISAWSRRYQSFTLITQNVDGLHEQAGTRGVLRLHGSLWELSCWEDCEESPPSWENRENPLPELPPQCPHCGNLARPDVVWFGESLDPEILEAAQQALDCEVFLTIGTSAEVHPAAGFIPAANQRGAYTVEINPDSTAASGTVDRVIAQPAETYLPELESQLNSPSDS